MCIYVWPGDPEKWKRTQRSSYVEDDDDDDEHDNHDTMCGSMHRQSALNAAAISWFVWLRTLYIIILYVMTVDKRGVRVSLHLSEQFRDSTVSSPYSIPIRKCVSWLSVSWAVFDLMTSFAFNSDFRFGCRMDCGSRQFVIVTYASNS